MKSLLAAFQFLSIIPIKIREINDETIANSMIFFPLVGLAIGAILTGIFSALLYSGLSQFAANIILIVMLIALTGGMHLDGLSDSADAFLSRKNKEQMLLIMRDSHAGVMGILSIICVILLKIALLISLDIALEPIALLLMCVISRWSMVFSIYLFPYSRAEGKAKSFADGINTKILSYATLITFATAFSIWGFKGMLIIVITALCVYLFGIFTKKEIGGITGDTIGATNEIAEITVLLCALIMQRWLMWIK